MKTHTIGISDCYVSSDPEAVLMTHALGSCIGIAIWDPIAGVGGLLHYMLPDSSMDVVKSDQQPCMFADTGIPLLFRTAYQLGAIKGRLIVTAMGGAQVIAQSDTFNIGKRNHLAMRKILWKAGVMVHCEDVGGSSPRTVKLEVGSGQVFVSCAGQQKQLESAEQARRRKLNGMECTARR